MKKHVINTYKKKETRGWDTIYWAVDIHDTCVLANYRADVLPTEFFPKAKEVLQRISSRKDSVLILYTCSYPGEIEKYTAFFKENGINFKFTNENPDAADTAFGHFGKKFYFNIMLEDKAGFDPTEHWEDIEEALNIIEAEETKNQQTI